MSTIITKQYLRHTVVPMTHHGKPVQLKQVAVVQKMYETIKNVINDPKFQDPNGMLTRGYANMTSLMETRVEEFCVEYEIRKDTYRRPDKIARALLFACNVTENEDYSCMFDKVKAVDPFLDRLIEILLGVCSGNPVVAIVPLFGMVLTRNSVEAGLEMASPYAYALAVKQYKQHTEAAAKRKQKNKSVDGPKEEDIWFLAEAVSGMKVES